MPIKRLTPETLPLEISRVTRDWGTAIRIARHQQRLTLKELAHRVQVSQQTLMRMESGDPTVQVGSYLCALWTLGLLPAAAPPLPEAMRSEAGIGQRVRVTESKDDDF